MKPQPHPIRKVMMTTDTIGGVWTFSIELARELRKRQISLALATLGPPLTRDQRREVRKLGNVDVFESQLKLEWMDDPWLDVARAGDWLLDLERRVKPDIAHLNSFTQGSLPFKSPKLVVGHSCVLSWWRAVKGTFAPTRWNRYQDEVTRGLRAADTVIAPTHAMLAALDRFYGPLRSIEVIPNGRDPAAFTPLPKENFVLVAGRLWDEAKNLETLMAVAPDLPWPVYFAGDWRHPDRDAEPPPQARMLGRLSPAALVPWFGRAAIYALPARYEPFGLSALEAALCGCGLVLGDISSLRETWDGAAVFVPPNDRESLKSTLKYLMANPHGLRQLATRSRARALEFTPGRMGAAYVSAYGRLASTALAGFEEGGETPSASPRGVLPIRVNR